LALRFYDATEQTISFLSVLEGELFGPLRDLPLLDRVELADAFGAIEWPTGADFDPETLHDWARYRDGLVEIARRWALAGTPPAERAG